MSGLIEDVFEDEEDVILEGSELHQALTNMGYTNFDYVPKVNETCAAPELEVPSINTYYSFKDTVSEKANLVCHYVLQENKLRNRQLEIILKADILLDDHAAMISEFLGGENTSIKHKILQWFPLIGSMISSSFYSVITRKKSTAVGVVASTVFGYLMYEKLKHWNINRNLSNLVHLQNELHCLITQCLKILRRTQAKKLLISELHEKQELIGNEKWNVIVEMRKLLSEIFEKQSYIYYQKAKEILDLLPKSVHLNCVLTKLEFESNFIDNDKSYDVLRSFYYTFILVQSEMMFIMANAYNGQVQKRFYRIPKQKLANTVKYLTRHLHSYHSKLSEIVQAYQLCEIQPVQRVFRGIPNSKWQDTYVHLDLTSQRIQLAFKEITSILETIDKFSEKTEDDFDLAESITEKMNEAYKQIENARSFAEFTSLLIAKAQRKPKTNTEEELKEEDLFPVGNENKKAISLEKELEIEDEVFEEYIKEEYLKPLYKDSDSSIIQEFKIDKLIKKNFMSELKEALIEKQKSMSERELKALKRMYNNMRRGSNIIKTEIEKIAEDKKLNDLDVSAMSEFTPAPLPRQSASSNLLCPKPTQRKLPPPPMPPQLPSQGQSEPPSLQPLQPPPPPPPPLPPLILENKVIAETIDEEDEESNAPVPLPRVKMFRPEDHQLLSEVQRFSINDCTPTSVRFHPLRVAEETFIGSGENSDEEYIAKKDSDSDVEDEDVVESE